MVYRQGDFYVSECGCFASDGPPRCAHAGERAVHRGRGGPLDPAAMPEARLMRAGHRQAALHAAQTAWERELDRRVAAAVAEGGVARSVWLDLGAVYRTVPGCVAAWARRHPRPSL